MKAVLKSILSCRTFFYPTEDQFSNGMINAAKRWPMLKQHEFYVLLKKTKDMSETLIFSLTRWFAACGWTNNPSRFCKNPVWSLDFFFLVQYIVQKQASLEKNGISLCSTGIRCRTVQWVKRTFSLGGNQLLEDFECCQKNLEQTYTTYPDIYTTCALIIHYNSYYFLV